MNTLTLYLVIIALIAMLAGVVYVSIKNMQKAKADRIKYENEIASLKKNIAQLVQHAEELAGIKHNQKETESALQEAKTDEEIADIVAAVINSNNNRVRK